MAGGEGYGLLVLLVGGLCLAGVAQALAVGVADLGFDRRCADF